MGASNFKAPMLSHRPPIFFILILAKSKKWGVEGKREGGERKGEEREQAGVEAMGRYDGIYVK